MSDPAAPWREPGYVFPGWAPRRMADMLKRVADCGWTNGVWGTDEIQLIARDLDDLLAALRDAS